MSVHRMVSSLALACCAAAPASAAVLFSEDFSSITPGPYGLGSAVGSFAVAAGSVDVIGNLNGRSGACPSAGRNNCVELAGGSAPNAGSLGTLASSRAIRVVAGRAYDLSFDLAGVLGSGSSRRAPHAGPAVAFEFGVEASLGSQSALFTVADGEPFDVRRHTFIFAADEAGATLQLRALNVDPDAGDRGAIVDNIVLSAVPEPGTGALTLGGLAVIGAAARAARRRPA